MTGLRIGRCVGDRRDGRDGVGDGLRTGVIVSVTGLRIGAIVSVTGVRIGVIVSVTGVRIGVIVSVTGAEDASVMCR